MMKNNEMMKKMENGETEIGMLDHWTLVLFSIVVERHVILRLGQSCLCFL